ncbi:MAG: YraN family protein [Desulfomonilaceae bacterium]|nr:YraN family protein [Desulfomonilaceae bacterium]
MSWWKPKSKEGTRGKGDLAEQIACDHLEQSGYRIVERNFHCKLGEIDIIARQGDELIFVEVRSKHSSATIDPVFSVNRGKQNRIARAAQVYLDRRFRRPPFCRFDVVIVTMGRPPKVEVIPNAFGT